MTVLHRQKEFPDEYVRLYNTTKRAMNNYFADAPRRCNVVLLKPDNS